MIAFILMSICLCLKAEVLPGLPKIYHFETVRVLSIGISDFPIKRKIQKWISTKSFSKADFR